MELIGKDEVLFELLKNVKIRILDSMVKKINIFIENVDDLFIEMDFDHLQFQGYYIRIRFSGIKEYSFYHHHHYIFRNVENFTILRHDGLYYLSITPDDERSSLISEDDQDFILCSSFEAYFLNTSPSN